MDRSLVPRRQVRPMLGPCTRSLACLAFVVVLAVAFWTGATLIVRTVMALASSPI